MSDYRVVKMSRGPGQPRTVDYAFRVSDGMVVARNPRPGVPAIGEQERVNFRDDVDDVTADWVRLHMKTLIEGFEKEADPDAVTFAELVQKVNALWGEIFTIRTRLTKLESGRPESGRPEG